MYDNNNNNTEQHSPESHYYPEERVPPPARIPLPRLPSALPPAFFARIIVAGIVITLISEFIDKLLR